MCNSLKISNRSTQTAQSGRHSVCGSRRFSVRYFLLCPAVLLFSFLSAQTPVFHPAPTKDLGNVRLSAVIQDSRGWLWCGSEEGGIYRYDGTTYQPIALADSMVSSAVTSLFESNGMLWVGFRNGMIGYIVLNNAFLSALSEAVTDDPKHTPNLMSWQPEEGLPKKAITAFAEDKSGGCWFGTYGEGLYVWKNQRLYQFNQADDGLASDDIYALAADTSGRIWVATDAGISICTMRAPGQKDVHNLTTRNGLPDEIITALLGDSQGNMWIGTHDQGICRFDVAHGRCISKTKNWAFGPITSLALFGSRELWVGTEAAGLVRVEASMDAALVIKGIENEPMLKAQALPAMHPLHHTRVRALCKDREGLLWVVCDQGALYSANVRFGLLEASLGSVQAVLVDSRSRLWAGSQEGLFFNILESPAAILRENIVALWESPTDGNVWVGTFGKGVYIVSPEGKVLKHLTERDGLPNGSVLSIAGNSREVWLATLGGVAKLELGRFPGDQKFIHQLELGTNYVYKILADSRGRIWFGTDGKGLAVLEHGAVRYFTMADGISLRTIYSIVEDRKGNIWFSTDRDGLFCFNGSVFQHFTTKNHLHSLNITGLAADGNGFIVVAYEDGFELLNPERHDHFAFWDAVTGAPTAEVNLNALCSDANGNVWLGTRQGVVRAAAFKERFLDDPQPCIMAVSVFSQPVDFLKQNTFAYDQNYFIFNFIGLWYTRPESVRYRYRLEGFDPDWKVSKDHLASYPNLPPGRYTFRVQTSEHGNFDNVLETSWAFVIDPPFWWRWWFVLLCAAMIGGVFFAFVHSRERRLQREAQWKRERVESQFESLKSQINPHFLFNSFNTLITIIEENPPVAVEYVEHLSDFYRSIMAYRERDFISVQEEMELVRSFYFLLKKRYESGFSLLDRLDGQMGQVMPLALQMLVENAVKHNVISASRPLLIEIFSEGDGYITVRNNIQPKIKPEPSTHFGLQSLIRRYELLGARPVTVINDGRFFVVKVPGVDF